MIKKGGESCLFFMPSSDKYSGGVQDTPSGLYFFVTEIQSTHFILTITTQLIHLKQLV